MASPGDLLRVKKHQITMMQRRGYVCPDAALLDYTEAELATYVATGVNTGKTDMFDVLTGPVQPMAGSKKTRAVLVWYTPQQAKEVPVDDARSLLDALTLDDGSVVPHRLVVVVSAGALGTKAMAPLEPLQRLGVRFQHFTYAELSYDPTHHFLYNVHERMSKEDTQRTLKAYRAPPSSYPTIYTSDPIAKYFDYPVGAFIRVHRVAILLMTNPSVYYRRVAHPPKKS